MSTADWGDDVPMTKSRTGHKGYSGYWACRKVRKDGTIELGGRSYRAPADALVQPEPGEWLLFFKYSDASMTPYIHEWTAPADPDNYIRRSFWRPAS